MVFIIAAVLPSESPAPGGASRMQSFASL